MKRRDFLSLAAAPALIRSLTAAGTDAPEWPQWRGPQRSGVSSETGLAPSWPSGGPPSLWSISNLGEGYGSLAIRGDRIYVQGVQAHESAVFCLQRSGGKTVWTTAAGRPYGAGSRQRPARHAHARWRSLVRTRRERRVGLSAGAGRCESLAAKYFARIQRAESQLAAERITPDRWRPCDRNAGWSGRDDRSAG